MAFDPSKPAEVVFDPSKPAEVVEAPVAAPAPLPAAPALSGGPTQRYPMRIPTDEQAGVASGPIVHPVTWKDRIGMAATPEEAAAARARRPADPMEVDPIAQTVVAGTLGAGAGGAVAPVLGRLAPAAPRIVQALTGATEGAVASKATGGDAATGAVLGAIPGAAAAGAGAAKKLLTRAGEAAEERGVQRAASTIEERVTKRTREGLQKDSVEELIREDKGIKKAAGNDAKLAAAVEKVKKSSGADLDRIYSAAPPEVDLAVPVMNMDRRIAELQAGNVEQRTIAKHLKAIRDEFNDSLGTREAVAPRELRDEQSAYQKAGYAKNPAADPDVSARIAANREASKAVGDAVLEHVTGLDYKAALAAAKENPDGIAAKLLKANDRYSAANRIEAAIEDRARNGKAQRGVISMAIDFGKHVGHSPAGAALSLAPAAVKAGVRAADDAIAAGAPTAARAAATVATRAVRLVPIAPVAAAGMARPSPEDGLQLLVARADDGDAQAAAKLAALTQRVPLLAARVQALRRRGAMP